MLLAALSLVLLAACAAPAGQGGSSATAPVLVNRTPNALVYVAFDMEVAERVDVMPAIDPAARPETVVAAGAEVEIDVEQTSGRGVVVVLYEVPAGHPGGPVPLTRTVSVTSAELRASRGRIVIEPA